MSHTRRSILTGVAGVASMVAAGCLGDDNNGLATPSNGESEMPPTWMTTTLEDILTGERFTIADLEPPIYIQNFAVWCSVCDRQERRLDDLNTQRDEITIISVNIDPNKDPSTVKQHAEDNGYEWLWTVPPAEVLGSMTDEFGTGMANAPNAPMILVCDEMNYYRLDHGLKSIETLETELDTC